MRLRRDLRASLACGDGWFVTHVGFLVWLGVDWLPIDSAAELPVELSIHGHPDFEAITLPRDEAD